MAKHHMFGAGAEAQAELRFHARPYLEGLADASLLGPVITDISRAKLNLFRRIGPVHGFLAHSMLLKRRAFHHTIAMYAPSHASREKAYDVSRNRGPAPEAGSPRWCPPREPERVPDTDGEHHSAAERDERGASAGMKSALDAPNKAAKSANENGSVRMEPAWPSGSMLRMVRAGAQLARPQAFEVVLEANMSHE